MTRLWSKRVTDTSAALALEEGVFTWKDPKRIARSLRRSAEVSVARKSPPFRAAMSMLNFYINRAGRSLPEKQRTILEKAKDELRTLYGKQRRSAGTHSVARSGAARRRGLGRPSAGVVCREGAEPWGQGGGSRARRKAGSHAAPKHRPAFRGRGKEPVRGVSCSPVRTWGTGGRFHRPALHG